MIEVILKRLDSSVFNGSEPLELPPYRVVPLADGYQLIKGNINQEGEKIYHLPTDK